MSLLPVREKVAEGRMRARDRLKGWSDARAALSQRRETETCTILERNGDTRQHVPSSQAKRNGAIVDNRERRRASRSNYAQLQHDSATESNELMDQQKLQAGLRRPRRRAAAPRPQSLPLVPVIPLDLDILESRTLYSGTPLVLDALDVETTEDAPNTDLNLHDLFSLDDGGGVVEFQLVENSHPGLFAGVAIDGSDHLILDFGDDAHGLADLTLRATNAAGQVEVLPIHVHVAPINDAPTAIDLQSVTVTDLDQGRTTIDLFAAFDDLEDADEDLTYTIAENTNPGLFASISIDESRGLLILEHAAGQSGTANLTIVATDTGHLSVGMETSPDFKVYDEINYLGPGELPSDQIGLSELSLWTSWYFFPYENGEYRYDELAYDKFLNFLNTFPDEMVDEPVVFDIENSFFENTPEGRDRFAEVFSLAKELRPDLEIGLYRFMPERSWRHAVNWYRAQEHFEMGIESWYTNNAALFEQNHEDWLSRNALYRTAPVTPSLVASRSRTWSTRSIRRCTRRTKMIRWSRFGGMCISIRQPTR